MHDISSTSSQEEDDAAVWTKIQGPGSRRRLGVDSKILAEGRETDDWTVVTLPRQGNLTLPCDSCLGVLGLAFGVNKLGEEYVYEMI